MWYYFAVIVNVYDSTGAQVKSFVVNTYYGYKYENGEWIGFDADYARAVCEKLGVTAEFKEIEWDYKLMALESKDIDCVWNGMTITEERSAAMTISVPYLANKQVAIVKKADAEKYAAADAAAFADKAKDAIIIVEKGSAGEELVKPVE